MKETAFLLPPLTRSAVRRAIDRLSVLPALLAGYRGSAPADRDALEALLLHIGDIAPSLARIVGEVEMNPVIVKPKGLGVCAVDALVRPVAP